MPEDIQRDLLNWSLPNESGWVDVSQTQTTLLVMEVPNAGYTPPPTFEIDCSMYHSIRPTKKLIGVLKREDCFEF